MNDEKIDEIAKKYTEIVKKKYNVFLDSEIVRIYKKNGKFFTVIKTRNKKKTIKSDNLLVVLGVVPNSDILNLEKTNVKTDEKGFVITNEYLETTAKAITKFTGAKAKAILVINPMDINMHNTVYAIVKDRTEPVILQKEIIGAGDYIPKFSGNLDTINQNAVRIAEEYAKNIRFNN